MVYSTALVDFWQSINNACAGLLAMVFGGPRTRVRLVSIRHAATKRYLDGKSLGAVDATLARSSRTPATDVYLLWVLGQTSDGRVYVRSASSGRYLDGRHADAMQPSLASSRSDPLATTALQWSIQQTSSGGTVLLTSATSYKRLAGADKSLYLNHATHNDEEEPDPSAQWIIEDVVSDVYMGNLWLPLGDRLQHKVAAILGCGWTRENEARIADNLRQALEDDFVGPLVEKYLKDFLARATPYVSVQFRNCVKTHVLELLALKPKVTAGLIDVTELQTLVEDAFRTIGEAYTRSIDMEGSLPPLWDRVTRLDAVKAAVGIREPSEDMSVEQENQFTSIGHHARADANDSSSNEDDKLSDGSSDESSSNSSGWEVVDSPQVASVKSTGDVAGLVATPIDGFPQALGLGESESIIMAVISSDVDLKRNAPQLERLDDSADVDMHQPVHESDMECEARWEAGVFFGAPAGVCHADESALACGRQVDSSPLSIISNGLQGLSYERLTGGAVPYDKGNTASPLSIVDTPPAEAAVTSPFVFGDSPTSPGLLFLSKFDSHPTPLTLNESMSPPCSGKVAQLTPSQQSIETGTMSMAAATSSSAHRPSETCSNSNPPLQDIPGEEFVSGNRYEFSEGVSVSSGSSPPRSRHQFCITTPFTSVDPPSPLAIYDAPPISAVLPVVGKRLTRNDVGDVGSPSKKARSARQLEEWFARDNVLAGAESIMIQLLTVVMDIEWQEVDEPQRITQGLEQARQDPFIQTLESEPIRELLQHTVWKRQHEAMKRLVIPRAAKLFALRSQHNPNDFVDDGLKRRILGLFDEIATETWWKKGSKHKNDEPKPTRVFRDVAHLKAFVEEEVIAINAEIARRRRVLMMARENRFTLPPPEECEEIIWQRSRAGFDMWLKRHRPQGQPPIARGTKS